MATMSSRRSPRLHHVTRYISKSQRGEIDEGMEKGIERGEENMCEEGGSKEKGNQEYDKK